MTGKLSPRAGKAAEPSLLVDVPRLMTAYFTGRPDPAIHSERVTFGTSGHRGSAFDNAFNEAHILAITEAICRYRRKQGIDGPLFLGKDTHALSECALASAVEVLAAHDIATMLDEHDGYTPTPVVSHAILSYNRGRKRGFADGIVITPSHNPPEEGGFKYNPPTGGPAGAVATAWIERAANGLLEKKLKGVKRLPYQRARAAATTRRHDYMSAYVGDLGDVVEMDAIRGSGVKIGIDPLGGAAIHFWAPIIERYGIAATVVNDAVDPTFRFMTLDWDGRIRMDCSSPYAMTRLIGMRDTFDVAFANDTDADRHGIVTRSGGLMNPNHYLAAAIAYLFSNRPGWSADCAVGKTVVSSAIIDRTVARMRRKLIEVPVGFKWFVDGLLDGAIGFAGEESAGAAFLRKGGSVWTTDKDGVILGLLAAEMTARTGRDPSQLYASLSGELGAPFYERSDTPATPEQKALLERITPDQIGESALAGEPIRAKLNAAPGNGVPFGGIKLITENGWFAARPSGTEEIYKIYAESFLSEEHLRAIQREANEIIAGVFARTDGVFRAT